LFNTKPQNTYAGKISNMWHIWRLCSNYFWAAIIKQCYS